MKVQFVDRNEFRIWLFCVWHVLFQNVQEGTFFRATILWNKFIFVQTRSLRTSFHQFSNYSLHVTNKNLWCIYYLVYFMKKIMAFSCYWRGSKIWSSPLSFSDHYREKRFAAMAVNKPQFNLQLSNIRVAMKTLISARTVQYKIAKVVVVDNVCVLWNWTSPRLNGIL